MIEWKEPQKSITHKRHGTAYVEEAQELIAQPGRWGVVAVFPPERAAAARQLTTHIRIGRISAFRPAGSFEAESRKQLDGTVKVHARYVPGIPMVTLDDLVPPKGKAT